MYETLWITLPINEENELKVVINLITSENLQNLTLNKQIDSFQKKLGCEQGSITDDCLYEEANKWQRVLREYSAIVERGSPKKHLITDTVEVLRRLKSVKRKFIEHGNSELAVREFKPKELLSLVILCYTNPTLIGPNLCEALKEHDAVGIKREMLENSAFVSKQGRVVPSQSNLRILSTALYFNDTAIRLPTNVIDRVTRETIQKGLIVRKVDRGGYEEMINGPERAAALERDVRSVSNGSNLNPHLLQGPSANSQFIGALSLNSSIPQNTDHPLIESSSPLPATNNSVNSISNGDLLIGAVAFYRIFNNLPVIRPVLSNIGKDLVKATDYIGSFFSCKTPELSGQVQQKTTLLSSVAKP